MRFLIISTGYNCAEFVKKNYASVLAQTYTNWKLVMISDGSTDGTHEEIFKLLPDKLRTEHNRQRMINGISIENQTGTKAFRCYPENLGAAFRRWHSIKKHATTGDVVVLLGMDDELMPNALSRIRQEYDAGKWMTYGNWQNQYGDTLHTIDPHFPLEFDDYTHATRNYRQVKYRSTAPNTFRKELFDKIRESDLKNPHPQGGWIMQTTESPVMFACLEMCGKDRIGLIKEPIYKYNMRSGGQMAKNRLGRENQERIYKHVTQLPKYNLYEHQ